MPGIKGIIRRFGNLLEASGLAFFAKMIEASPGKKFMRIGLMPDIKDQFVVREIKEAMQGHNQLDVTKVWGKVAPIFATSFDYLVTKAQTKQV